MFTEKGLFKQTNLYHTNQQQNMQLSKKFAITVLKESLNTSTTFKASTRPQTALHTVKSRDII